MTFSTLSGNKLSGLSGAADFSNTSTGSYAGYKYVTFAASGSLVVTRAGFADLVVVGGGGGGATDSGGGGGAGGVLMSNVYLPAGTITCTVGAGGAGNAGGGPGNNGRGSRIGDYYALGGGGGGNGNYMTSGLNGGSGGGE